MLVHYRWQYDASNVTGGFTAPLWRGYPSTTRVPVSFDLRGHGKAVPTQQVTYGSQAAKPAKPRASGWTFTGWFATATAVKPFAFTAPITRPVRLQAGWLRTRATLEVAAPTQGVAGGKVRVTAAGLGRGEAYTIRVAGTKVASGRAGRTGKVDAVVRVPASTRPGTYAVVVTGAVATRTGQDSLRVVRSA